MQETLCGLQRNGFRLRVFYSPLHKETRWEQITTKQGIMGENEFPVHMTELTGPCYHSAKSI